MSGFEGCVLARSAGTSGAPNMGETQGVGVPPRGGRRPIEAKRRASDREAGVKEAWSEAAGRWTRTGYEAPEDRDERPSDREVPATKGRRRRSGDRAAKCVVLTSGDLALRLKGRRGVAEREVSRGRSSRRGP